MTDRYRFEVDDQHGSVAVFVDADAAGQLTRRKRDQLAGLAAGLVRDLAAALGVSEDHATHVAISELTRRVADDAAYERVAERKGLLPL